MGRPINRVENKNDPRRMVTFQMAAPKSTHFRKASCEEVECAQYVRGWRMRIDLTAELGQKQAHYIKHSSGRSYKVVQQNNGLVELEFAPNQPCFKEHQVRLQRPDIYRVKGGDYRGNPLNIPTRVHKNPAHWVEEFQENQDNLKTQIERG